MRTLAEDLLLFALDDATGTTSWRQSGSLPFVLAGALLADLALREKLTFEGKSVVVSDSTPIGDEILDQALALIVDSRRPRNGKHWVQAIKGKVKRLRPRLEDRLVTDGILRRERRRFLFVIADDRHPTADPSAERTLRNDVRAALLDGAAPTPRIAVLISLLQAAKLLDIGLAKNERKAIKPRVKAVIEGEMIGAHTSAAAKAAIAAAEAADAAASIAVTAAVVASS